MCTKEEVRYEVRQALVNERTPLLTKNIVTLFGIGVLGLLGWILLTVHSYDGSLQGFKNDIDDKLHEMKMGHLVNIASLSNNVALLTTQIKNIKDVAVVRNKASDELEDVRCNTMADSIKRNKALIEKYHKLN